MNDYKNLASRMYAAVYALLQDDDLNNKHWHTLDALCTEYREGEEAPKFPLPEWAESYNENRELKVRAQLCTKDGRRCGNARVLSLVTKEQCGMSNDYWHVRTDVGTTLHLLSEEVNEMFYIGNFIMKEGE